MNKEINVTQDFIDNIFGFQPSGLSEEKPYKGKNYVNGEWKECLNYKTIINPLNGEKFISIPDTQSEEELLEFKNSVENCPKSGLHNPLKNPERYNIYGQVCHRIAFLLGTPLIEDFFTQLIQKVTPKHDTQARGEVVVTQRFLMNFSGDQCRFLVKSFNVSGDHFGQQSTGYRWPYGPVAIISPFNFPMEIPVLQLIGALITGNKVIIKSDQKVSIVLECFIKLLLFAGLPQYDLDLIHCDGQPMEKLIKMTKFRMLQFTGSSYIAEKLSLVQQGRIRIEDAGFDWKVLGPDVCELDYVSQQCDQDAYAFSGQKCSAQSILFAHQNWVNKGIYEQLEKLASKRKLSDLSICPILTWDNNRISTHVDKVLQIPGSKLLFGGKPLEQGTHKIPDCYGSFYPTAIFVPLEQIQNPQYFELVTTELFGPFQIVTQYDDKSLKVVLDILELIPHNLTAGVVSNDINFVQYILANTVNGVTYAGIRARTTGAPQNHWFGPCGDPRGTGIGSPEAILQTWTSHREIINDYGPVLNSWKLQNPS